MAYANLLSMSCINPKGTFQHFRDFMCKRNGTYDYSSSGIGWTYHDSVYAVDEDTITINDYFVMYSAGEDGQRDMYVKVQYVSGVIKLIGYLYWNNTTHVGVIPCDPNNAWTNTLDTNNILWVYGDLDAFVGIAKYATQYHSGVGGWMPGSPFDQTVTTLGSSITTGSAVTKTFTSVPAGWAVGTKLFVRDLANTERVNISGVSGNDVTFTTFVNSYSTGCKFCLEDTTYTGPASGNMMSGVWPRIDHAGVKANSVIPLPMPTNPTSGDGLTGKYPRQEVLVASAVNLIGPIKNIYATLSIMTSETTHTIDGVGYRYFSLVSGFYVLIKEV